MSNPRRIVSTTILVEWSDNIDISFASEHKDEFNKDFQMPLIDVDGEQLSIPETDYDLIFTINTKKFKSIIALRVMRCRYHYAKMAIICNNAISKNRCLYYTGGDCE